MAYIYTTGWIFNSKKKQIYETKLQCNIFSPIIVAIAKLVSIAEESLPPSARHGSKLAVHFPDQWLRDLIA